MATLQSFSIYSTYKPHTSQNHLPLHNTKNLLFSTKKASPLKHSISIKPSTISSLEIEPETNDTDDLSPQDPRPLNQIWREIQGSNNWQTLLDPMNSHLRQEIIGYGEMAQACYDSFDFDPHSKYCGTCKYPGPHFFEKQGMSDMGYTLTRFLYATSNINLPNFFQRGKVSSIWSQHANWMGYVAVTTDEEEIKRLGRRNIVVAWRGTVTYLEWIHDLKNILHPAHFRNDPSIKIESGFFDFTTRKQGISYK